MAGTIMTRTCRARRDGKNAPALWKRFSDWYGAVFAEGALTSARSASSLWAWRMPFSVRTASTRIRKACLRRARTEQMSEAVHVASPFAAERL